MGEKLKAARLAAGLTQAQLAERLGIQQTSIARYESGTREPLASTLKQLALALNCAMEDLI